jgi:hypothetical protein
MFALKSKYLLGAGLIAMSLSAAPALAQMETPKPGGTVELTTVYPTISALSWDNYDFNWKHNHDTGAVYEQLFAADISKTKSRGGKLSLVSDAYVPTKLIRGELAEKWEWKQNPLQLVIKIREGVMFPAKEGVMKSRELVAEDVVYAFKRMSTSPKATKGYFDYVNDVKATDKHTVTFDMKEYNAEWDYRFGYGYYSGIIPKEVVDAGPTNWKNVNGTGPFKLTDYVSGNSNTYEKNADYWDKETINGQQFKLPYIDKMVYRIIKDEATRITALRTGKLDVMELVRWQDVDTLKKSNPQLKWNKWLATSGTFLSMRVDTKPFDDVRVRRALNMALYRGREHLGKKVARRSNCVRHPVSHAMMTSDQAPEPAVNHDRQAHGSPDIDVSQVFDMDRRHASENRMTEIEWSRRGGIRFIGVDRHLVVLHVGDQPQRVAHVERAGLWRDVRCGKTSMQERFERRHAFFGHNFATVVLMEAIGHHAVETGQVAHGRNRLAQQGGDVLPVSQLTHAAVREQGKCREIKGRGLPLFQFDAQPVVVSMNHGVKNRIADLDFKVQRRTFLPCLRIAQGSIDGCPQPEMHADRRDRPKIAQKG